MVKSIYEHSTANIILNAEREYFHIKNRTGMSALITSVQHCTGGVLASAAKQEKEGIWIGEKLVFIYKSCDCLCIKS